MQRDYAHYHVALKVLMRKGDEILFLMDTGGTRFDLPGGRIDDVEHDTPLSEILAREIREELGVDVKYKIGKPIFQFRRHFAPKGWYIFLTAYEAEFLSGSIQISPEHSGFRWINPKKSELKENEFFNKEEYLAFKKYFESIK